MNTDPHHDDAIDQVLAALRRSTPPEGMEARVATRIAQQTFSAAPTPSRLAWLAPSPSWWRGAVTGAAFALFAMGVFLSVSHLASSHTQDRQLSATVSPAPRNAAPHPAAVAYSATAGNHPCLRPALLPTTATSQYAAIPELIAQVPLTESAAPSRPAPVLPLTPQERELAHLVRTTDPRQLAALGRGEEARLEAERASELTKFVTQPAAAQTTDAASGTASPSVTPAPSTAPPETTPDAPANPTTAVTAADQQAAPEIIDPNPSTIKEDQK